MHCDNLRLVLGLGLVRVSSRVRVRIRVKVRVSVMVRVSIRTSWVVNFTLFHGWCYFPSLWSQIASVCRFCPSTGSMGGVYQGLGGAKPPMSPEGSKNLVQCQGRTKVTN